MKKLKTIKSGHLLGLIWVLLVVFRFTSLGSVPVFGDEANHLMLADYLGHDWSVVIRASRGGILPGLLAPLSLLIRFFGDNFNILVMARAFSVLCDIASSLLLYLIGTKIFHKPAGIFAAIVYLLIPLNFFHGRLVMLEPLMSAFFLAALYFQLRLSEKLTHRAKIHEALNLAVIIFICLFLSFVTKPLVAVSLGALLILPRKLPIKYYVLTLGIFAVTLAAVFPFVSLSADHFYRDYVLRNTDLLWLNFKTNLFRSHLWIQVYYPLPIILISLLGIIWGSIKKEGRIFWLTAWTVTVIILDSLVGGKLFYPRHLFPLAFPVSLLVGFILSGLFRRPYLSAKIAVLVVIIWLVLPILKLKHNPERAELAAEDRLQFYADWASGVGIREAAADFKQISQEGDTVVYVGDEALLTWALPRVFDLGRTKVKVIEGYYGGETPNLEEKISRGPNNYLMLNRVPYLPADFRAELVASYSKKGNRKIELYRLKM